MEREIRELKLEMAGTPMADGSARCSKMGLVGFWRRCIDKIYYTDKIYIIYYIYIFYYICIDLYIYTIHIIYGMGQVTYY